MDFLFNHCFFELSFRVLLLFYLLLVLIKIRKSIYLIGITIYFIAELNNFIILTGINLGIPPIGLGLMADFFIASLLFLKGLKSEKSIKLFFILIPMVLIVQLFSLLFFNKASISFYTFHLVLNGVQLFLIVLFKVKEKSMLKTMKELYILNVLFLYSLAGLVNMGYLLNSYLKV